MDGVLIIDKPESWTSHDVVAKIRNITKIRKVGHTGTLDPFATGVLVVCLGTRTPLSGYPAETYAYFLALALLVQILGWLSVSYVLGHLPAAVVSPTLLGQPVITALLAVPLLGETLSPRHIAGGIAVLAGVLIVHRSHAPRPGF